MPHALDRTSTRRSLVRIGRWAALLGLVALTGCSGGDPAGDDASPAALKAEAVPATSAPPATAAASRARPPVALAVQPLGQRLRPDVLISGPSTFSEGAVARLRALSPENGAVVFRTGTVRVNGKDVRAVGVDPSTFRTFAAQGTAESDAVWQAVARGEAVTSHEAAKTLGLALGARTAGG